MVKKTEDKKDINEENIFKTWADSYTAVSKIWEDSCMELYKPLIKTTGEMFEKTALLSREATPQKYKEFYDEWIKTYQATTGKSYPIPTSKNNLETLEKFMTSAEEFNKLYRSWSARLEENSRKTQEILQGKPDPAKQKECYDMWMKSYEQIFDELLELPAKDSTKYLFGNFMGMPDIYSNSFLQMSKLWKKSYEQLCGPMNASMQKISEKMAKISMGDANPEAYKEFYTLWLDTYKEIYGKYGTSNETSREMIKHFEENTNIFLSMYKSWIAALEEMSEQAKEMSKQTTNPDTYNEFCNLWIKTYQKAFENFFQDMPDVGPMKDIMEPLKIMARTYADTFLKMSNMCMKSDSGSASAYPGKNKK